MKRDVSSLLLGAMGPAIVFSLLFLAGCKKGGDEFGFAEDTGGSTTPRELAINNYSPTDDPVIVTSTGSKAFTVGASGTGNLAYEWNLSGTTIPGADSSFYLLNYATLQPLGYTPQTLTVTVSDDNSPPTESHTFDVLLNAPPVLSGQSPSATVVKNYATADLTFSVTGSDGNGDALTYSWTYDGSTSLPAVMNASDTATGSQAIFNPDVSHVGTHTITVTARETRSSDYEYSNTVTWTVTFNYFSDECNGLDAGEICTLVGQPGLMKDSDDDGYYSATTEPVKIRPNYIYNDGSGLFISDSDSHVVWYHNRSGAAVVRLGRTIDAGKVRILVGNGGAGKTTDNSASYTYERYKLNGPQMMYYDSAGDYLYIADHYNHRVVQVDSTGQGRRVFGIEATTPNNHTTNGLGSLATTHLCSFPVGLVVNAAKDTMWVSCTGNNYVTYSAIKEINMSNPTPANWTAKTIVGTGGNTASQGLRADSVEWFYGITGVAATDVISVTGHPFVDDDPVMIASLGGGAGITAGNGTVYYVRNSVAGVSFQLYTAAFPGGALVNFTSDISSGVIATPLATGLTAASAGDTISYTAHPFANGDPVLFLGKSGAAGFNLNTVYYVVGAAANTFQIATSKGGAAIDITSNGTVIGLMRGPAGTNYPLALALDSNENLYWTENNSSGSLMVLRRSASPASYFNGALAAEPIGETLFLAGGNNDRPSVAATNVVLRGGSGAAWRDARGLVIYESGGNIESFFLSMGLRSMVIALNNSSGVRTYGGNAISPATTTTAGACVGIVWGIYADPDVPSTTTPATNNRVFNPQGLALDGTDLLLADTYNFAVRKLSLSSGAVATVTGGVAHKHRATTESTGSETAPNTKLFLVDQLLYDDDNTRLLIADNSNAGASWNVHEFNATATSASFNPAFRIRSLALGTGLVNTLLGGGYGAASSGTHSFSDASIQGLRGMTLLSDGSLAFVDRYQFASGNNLNCQVRVANFTGSATSYFGQSVGIDSIIPVFGFYGTSPLGCNNATAVASGITSGLNLPEGIVMSGTDLYVSEYNRHCIWKLDSLGNTSTAIGTCGTQGNSGGALVATAKLRYPKQLMSDPRFPTNFFVMDQTNQATSSIKYVNLSGQDCDSGAGHACEVNATPVADNEAGEVLAVTGGYGRAMAYYADPDGIAGDLFCYSSSESHNSVNSILPFGDTAAGANNVICKNRVTGVQSLRIGQSDSSTLNSGMQVDDEHEGIGMSGTSPNVNINVTLNGPAGLAFDADGNLYISEKNSHVIRKVKKWW